QELAGRELTRGFISQLEKGIVMPSLKSLELIASRLYKPVAYFLEDSQPEPGPDAQRWAGLERALWRLLEGDWRPAQEALARGGDQPDGLPRSDEGTQARLEVLSGLMAMREGDGEAGVRRVAAGLRALRAAGPSRFVTLALAALGWQLLRLGRWAEAVEPLDEARRLLGDGQAEEACLARRVETWLAVAYAHSGRTEQALPMLESAWQRAREQEHYVWPGQLLLALGRCYAAAGEPERAREALERAVGLARSLGLPQLEAAALEQQAALLREQGHGRPALEGMERAAVLYRRMGQASEAARLEVEMARLLLEQGRADEALARASAVLEDPGARPEDRVRLLLLSGQTLARMGRVDEAVARLEQAAALAQAQGLRRELAGACSELGRLLREQGQHDRASEYLARALELYEQTSP
ncbi:MAG TPA: tetratricopeptide repeat protein, partial [Limnochordales bacterium]